MRPSCQLRGYLRGSESGWGIVAAQIDGRSDIWAIGVCVFQLLTGDVPFRAPPGQHRRNIIGEVLYNATAAVR